MKLEQLKNKIESHSEDYNNINEQSDPKTLFQVLNIQNKEKTWHRLLEYYITPSESHGFGSDVLVAFLQSISEHHPSLEIQNPRRELTDVVIESEVSVEGGRPDLILYFPDEWLVCVEIKVDAEERDEQTKRYVEESWIASRFEPSLEEKYVYLAPEGEPSPDHEAFSKLSWESVIRQVQRTVGEQLGRYPAASAAQLTEFMNAAEDKLDMKDAHTDPDTIEKARLRLEHADAINETHAAFVSLYEDVESNWPDQLIQQYGPVKWPKEWSCGRDKKSEWGQIYHKDWRLDENFKPISDVDDATVKLQFVHKIKKKYLLDGKLIFRTKWPNGGNSDLREDFREQLMSESNKQRWLSLTNERGIKCLDRKKIFTESIYEFNQERFPESYYETLAEAFDDHAELADLLTESLDEVVRKSSDKSVAE